MAERRRRVAALAFASTLALAACGGQQEATSTGPRAAIQLDAPYHPAEVALTDTDGGRYDLAADTDADVTLIFFGYTNCPDICQMVMSTIAAAKLRLPEEDRDRVDVVFVSTDPARDTGPVLRDYLDRFDPTFVGVRGDPADIVTLGESLAIHVGKGPQAPLGRVRGRAQRPGRGARARRHRDDDVDPRRERRRPGPTTSASRFDSRRPRDRKALLSIPAPSGRGLVLGPLLIRGRTPQASWPDHRGDLIAGGRYQARGGDEGPSATWPCGLCRSARRRAALPRRDRLPAAFPGEGRNRGTRWPCGKGGWRVGCHRSGRRRRGHRCGSRA